MTDPAPPLLEVEDLRVWYPVRAGVLRRRVGWVKAVDGVSFRLERSMTLGLVGESGCGKSSIGRAVVRVTDPYSGAIRLDGTDLVGLTGDELRSERRRFQMVFQDPLSSLDPRQNIGRTIEEPLRIHGLGSPRERAERVGDLLRLVGLPPDSVRRFPHEFSGGQRQRVGIARALALEPDILVCDEPISALDVSIQAQIVTLLEQIQADLGIALLFIAHDLAVVRHIAQESAVVYLGKIVEHADTATVFSRPAHPYTAALLSSAPIPDSEVEQRRERIPLVGDLPNPSDPPSGCRFHTRCWLRKDLGDPDICVTEDPPLVPSGNGVQRAACHFVDECISAVSEMDLPTVGSSDRPSPNDSRT